MRLYISMMVALGLCLCALASCSPQDGSAPAANNTRATNGQATAQTAKQTPAQPPADQTRRISIEETQAAAARGNTLIVDVRDEGSYKASHIKGAKSIPLPQFAERASELPKDKLIITYCA